MRTTLTVAQAKVLGPLLSTFDGELIDLRDGLNRVYCDFHTSGQPTLHFAVESTGEVLTDEELALAEVQTGLGMGT